MSNDFTFRGSTAVGTGYYGGAGSNYNNRNNSAAAVNGYNSPVGWDKSYPLKPMQTSTAGGAKTISNGSNAPIYRKNSSIGLTTNGRSSIGNGNKYSGGYGMKRTPSRSRGTSLDRRASAELERRRINAFLTGLPDL